ncbi:MAG: MazG family protein [Clostridia bacterium]|nr:MazG family protein [Clostridia bacterium]
MSVKDEIAALMKKECYNFEDLIAITRILRSEEGCPWDREQDHHSVRSSLIEETYEVVEAVDTENPTLLREELGDLLFQVMFHAQIETEEARFGIGEVVDDICKKMIHRHPHVFGTVSVESSAEVLKNWESIKTEEKQRNTLVDKLRAIPPMMPALMRASKVGKKAGQAEGLGAEAVLDCLEDQIGAMRDALSQQKLDAQTAIGAFLMGVCDLSRKLDVDAEHALSAQTDRLIDGVAQKNT